MSLIKISSLVIPKGIMKSYKGIVKDDDIKKDH